MAIPSIFSQKGGTTIATYDYLDLASGTGYKTFYGLGIKDASGIIYSLVSSNSLASSRQANLLTSSSGTQTFNLDFTFYAPTIIQGDAYVTFTWYAPGGGSAGTAEFEFYHVRGVTETLIGEITSQSLGVEISRETLKASLTSTPFSIGDIYRVKVKMARSGGTINLLIDPTSRATYTETGTGITIGSSLLILTPFKVDL